MKQNNIFFRYFSPVAAQQKLYAAALVALLSSSAYEAEAQVGEPFIHDPSTIALCDGKYYTFGTGEGGLWSEDGWTWQSGAVRPGRGAAPDVLKIGDRYLVAYSATGGGLGGSHRGDVLTMWNKTLDPKSPDFKYTEPVVVASSLDDEDCDAIDAGLLLDPTVILFTITAVAFTVCGCLLTAKAMDYLRISPYFCGKDHFFCRK